MQGNEKFGITFSALVLFILGLYALGVALTSLLKRRDTGLINRLFKKYSVTFSLLGFKPKNNSDGQKFWFWQAVLYLGMGTLFITIALKIFLDYIFFF
jgi:hypothetical protein